MCHNCCGKELLYNEEGSASLSVKHSNSEEPRIRLKAESKTQKIWTQHTLAGCYKPSKESLSKLNSNLYFMSGQLLLFKNGLIHLLLLYKVQDNVIYHLIYRLKLCPAF